MSKIEEIELQIQSLGTEGEASTDRVDLLNQLAQEVATAEPRRALEISRQAHELSEDLGYEKGLAYSKQSLGFAHTMVSNYDAALRRLYEALPMFDKLGDEGGARPESRGPGAGAAQHGGLRQGAGQRVRCPQDPPSRRKPPR